MPAFVGRAGADPGGKTGNRLRPGVFRDWSAPIANDGASLTAVTMTSNVSIVVLVPSLTATLIVTGPPFRSAAGRTSIVRSRSASAQDEVGVGNPRRIGRGRRDDQGARIAFLVVHREVHRRWTCPR